MGNRFCKKKTEPVTKPKIRRIYVGDVPELRDDDAELPHPIGRRGKLERTSQQSFQDRETTEAAGAEAPPAIPVRRQSIIGEPATKKHKNAFPNNEVTSSTYTMLTFIPFNLFEQFRRVVNFYFLVVGCIQLSISSPVSPVTAIAPLVFVIFVTMLKQGYEDWLRHKADNLFNNRPVKVVRDGVIEVIKSKDVQVGDVLKLEGEEQVPTDLILLGSSDEFQRCLLNTANLDGETNLKMRYVHASLPHFRDESDFMTLRLIVECEEPCEDLYRFNGNVLMPSEVIDKFRSKLATIVEVNSEEATAAGYSNANGHANADRKSVSKGATPPSTIPGHGHGHSAHGTPSAASASNSEKSNSSAPHGRKNQRRVGMVDFTMIMLGIENVILRGTKVKNTDFVYGVVIYTGADTRLARNSNMTGPKYSTVENSVNRYIFFFILLLLFLVVSATLISIFNPWITTTEWYLHEPNSNKDFKYYFNIFASFLILFNYIIPISLYVTIEMQKFIGSKFFVWDQDMSTDLGEPPLCNTSDLNEELGQIEYLFSDKTGTLTENVMKTKIFSVNTSIYDVVGGKLYLRNPDDQSKTELKAVSDDKDLLQFCRTLALCHSIQIMPKRRPSIEGDSHSGAAAALEMFLKKKKKKISSKVKNANSLFTIGGSPDHSNEGIGVLGGNWEFQGSSPDEKALVESCVQFGVSYEGEKSDVMNLKVVGKMECYKRLMSLDFDADRKRMSVIVENEAGEIYLLTKGAESTVVPNCDTGQKDEVLKHILTFSMMGLRTLVIAERKLTRQEFDKFKAKVQNARLLTEKREEAMKALFEDIESHMHVLGATGVEDQLQEGVMETIHSLVAAGIRVWVLTGDKVETATAVAYSCGLMTSLSKQFALVGWAKKREENTTEILIEKLNDCLQAFEREMVEDDNNVLIVDGESIELAFDHCPELFCKVAMKSYRVICCRMTPLQKSQVVKMVKNTPKKPVTAAIGDGANDVAMIQEAHIGIGIIGKEGRQAARCADFALAKFGFLSKAVLVHGYWYYVRIANLANYFFYKNIVFVFPQVYYCFHSGFSTQPLFNGEFLMFYNILFTACPILFYGFFEQPYSAKELLAHPDLYRGIRRNYLMSKRVFCKWMIFAVFHSYICYWFVYYSWSSFFPITDLSCYGMTVFCAVISVVNMKIALESKYMTLLFGLSHLGSFFLFALITGLYSDVDLRSVSIDPGEFRGSYSVLMQAPSFWVLMVLIPFTALFPDVIWKAMENSWDSVLRFFKAIPQKIHQNKPLPHPRVRNLSFSTALRIVQSNQVQEDAAAAAASAEKDAAGSGSGFKDKGQRNSHWLVPEVKVEKPRKRFLSFFGQK